LDYDADEVCPVQVRDMRFRACQAQGMAPQRWYFCLKHQQVEPNAGCRSAERLGPYADEETAARALELARERTKAADEADRRWDGED
jgi:hypothetical protein